MLTFHLCFKTYHMLNVNTKSHGKTYGWTMQFSIRGFLAHFFILPAPGVNVESIYIYPHMAASK